MKRIILITIAIIPLLFQFACSKVEGTISINYIKATAVYGDLDSLRNVPLMAKTETVSTAVGHFVGSDFILIGERSKGIHIYDNTNISAPINVGFLTIPFCKEFYVDGDYLYAEAGYDLLKINIKDFRNPFIAYRMKDAFAEVMYNDNGKALLGFTYEQAVDVFEAGSPEAKEIKKQGKLHVDYNGKMIPLSTVPTMFTGNNGKAKGTINRIAVYYNYIYVIGNDKLHIFSTSNGNISKANTIDIEENSESVYIDRNRMYIGSASAVSIYLLDNYSNPKSVSTIDHSTSCDPVLADGDIAYSTLRSTLNEGCAGTENVLLVLDVETAKRASLLETIEMKSPYGMAIINEHLLVAEGINGLSILNIEDRKKPGDAKSLIGAAAFDVMAHPTLPNVIIVTNQFGLKEYSIDWKTLTMSEVGALYYK